MDLNKIKNIIEGIRKYYPVTDGSIRILAESFTENHLQKNHLLTQAGVIDNKMYFIEKGCTRTYFIIDGKEIRSEAY